MSPLEPHEIPGHDEAYNLRQIYGPCHVTWEDGTDPHVPLLGTLRDDEHRVVAYAMLTPCYNVILYMANRAESEDETYKRWASHTVAEDVGMI